MPGYTSSNRVMTGKAADNAVPNLYWRSLTKEALRAQQRYVALPHVRTLSFSSTADYRFVMPPAQCINNPKLSRPHGHLLQRHAVLHAVHSGKPLVCSSATARTS